MMFLFLLFNLRHPRDFKSYQIPKDNLVCIICICFQNVPYRLVLITAFPRISCVGSRITLNSCGIVNLVRFTLPPRRILTQLRRHPTSRYLCLSERRRPHCARHGVPCGGSLTSQCFEFQSLRPCSQKNTIVRNTSLISMSTVR